MLDTIEKITSFLTVPVLLFIGWAIYIIWSKQEKLYKQQSDMFEKKYKLAHDELQVLREQLKPSELHAEVGIIKTSFNEKLAALEEEKKVLAKELEQKNIENTELLHRYESNQNAISYQMLKILRHELMHNIYYIRHALNQLRRLSTKGLDEKNKKMLRKTLDNIDVIVKDSENVTDNMINDFVNKEKMHNNANTTDARTSHG